jgi:enediyne polyketide synthase
MATLAVLRFFGLEPHIAIGHSLGEISALAAGGAWDAGTAVRLAALRGQAMASLNTPDPGGMVALAAQPDEVEKLIKPFGPALVISNFNSARQTVASGTTGALCGQFAGAIYI